MGFFMYAHGGSGNHGCEAIVRSTLNMLDNPRVTLISSRPEEDIYYEIDKLCTVVKDTDDQYRRTHFRSFIKAYLALKVKKDYVPMDKLRYVSAFSLVKPGDIAFSIGGDNYCYGDTSKYKIMHDMLKDRGVVTVLWGCSVEPNVVENPKVSRDLARYNLITARETISYNALKAVNPNTILVTDPAFMLGMKETVLPKEFEDGNTVGINLSPMAMKNESVAGITWNNYIKLITYIINETSMNVALIPHVVWDNSDDRVPLAQLYDKFKESKRVCYVEDRTCQELKYVISKCRFFVGARTHATIAAYSACVPTLVLGYSVKSRGIAIDLFGTDEGYVIPVQSLEQEDSVLRAFMWIEDRETKLRHHLEQTLPAYLEKNCRINNAIAGLKLKQLFF